LIYIDTSVVLAQLLAEDRRPPPSLWSEPLVSSRLLEYETWTRIDARALGESHVEAARETLSRISFLEPSPIVLGRALEPFPVPIRTLDALHLASVEYLRAQRLRVRPRDLRSPNDRFGPPLANSARVPSSHGVTGGDRGSSIVSDRAIRAFHSPTSHSPIAFSSSAARALAPHFGEQPMHFA